MITLGLDIGSRSIDAVWLDDTTIVDAVVTDSGFEPADSARALAGRRPVDALVATGYGRHAARDALGCALITEIKAYGAGAGALFPTARGVLDIGGQDTKAIALGPGGRVLDFSMNDKCSAGTGKFLEVMARALGFTLAELADASLAATETVAISSMCTVFAESEVTGLVHKRADRGAIARGLHDSIGRRTLAFARRVIQQGPLLFAGGVAKNAAMVEVISTGFDGEVLVPCDGDLDAQLVGAYGAALTAQRQAATG